MVTKYDDVALYHPVYFHPLADEVKSNPMLLSTCSPEPG